MSEHELSAVPRQARSFQGHRAGIVSRVAAAAVDTIAVVVAVLVGYLAVAGVQFLVKPRDFHFHGLGPEGTLLVGAVVLVGYLTAAWAIGGRTYGDLLMGLRVVTTRGHRLSWIRAAIRAVLYLVVPLGLLWVAIDRRGRSLQDIVLRTAVVYDWQPHDRRVGPPPPIRPPPM
jgi:uncharacterized RDD family membrane protein YckC